MNKYSKEANIGLEKDTLMKETLDDHLLAHYITGKRAEWDEYNMRVSSWESEKYITTY